MNTAQIRTRCECQARLEAILTEAGTVLSGTASKGDEHVKAPATAMGAGSEQFRIGWNCPLCGRNTLRSFYRGAITFSPSAG